MQEKLENVIYIEIQDALFSSLPFPGKFPPLFSISAILLSAYIGLQVSIRFLLKFKFQVRGVGIGPLLKIVAVNNHLELFCFKSSIGKLFILCAKYIQHRK